MAEMHTRGGQVWRARGIPVATTRGRRFRAPTEPEPWRGIRHDNPEPPLAPQHANAFDFARPGPVVGIEDECVHASVFAPAGADGLPVLVWIHGGGGFAGSSTARDAGALAAAMKVVVVALSFRVGALGHLHVGDLLGDDFADSGNAAVHDIQAGLDWVTRESASFGGDPERVTLAGQSAGAALVATLLTVKRPRTRISRAIMQSGTAERVHSPEAAASIASQVAEAIGGADRLLACSADDLLSAQAVVLRRALEHASELPTPFRPVVRTPTLSHAPLDAMRAGVTSGTVLLIGTNLRECAPSAHFFPSAPAALTLTGGDYAAALARMRASGWNVGSDLAAWCTDASYRQPTERILGARAASSAPTYAYVFEGNAGHAPVHNGELDSLFGDDSSAPVSTSLPSLWGEFIEAGSQSALGGFWRPHQSDHTVAVLGASARAVSDPFRPLREAWA